jgi:hypothetical protein
LRLVSLHYDPQILDMNLWPPYNPANWKRSQRELDFRAPVTARRSVISN